MDAMTSPGAKAGGFLRSVSIDRSRTKDARAYPWAIPAVAKLGELFFHPKVTFLVGEHYRITRDFLAAPERFFRTLFRKDEPED
jgi:hypothetical protein